MKQNNSNKEATVLTIGDKVYKLQVKDFSNAEIDVEEILQVDYNNIMGDIITFPVLFNRIAWIKAEMDNLVRQTALDSKIFEAELYDSKKKDFIKRGEKVTEAALENAIKLDRQYKVKKYAEFEVQKQADMIDGLYWAAKSKTKMLEAISMKLQPEEFTKDILEGTINSVMIKVQKNYFAK